MNRLIFMLFVTSAGIMLAPPLANAQLFGRRGCSTGHCFTPHVQHVAPIVEKRDILQNFFIGLSPTPLDSPRGTTFYARDLASEVQLASDLDYINLSKQFLSSATDVASTARSVRPGLEAIASKNAEANLTLAKGEAVATAFRSISNDTSGTARTVVMTLRNGKLEQFQELQATTAEEAAPVPRQPRGANDIVNDANPFKAIGCTSCHGGDKPKGELTLEGVVPDDVFRDAVFRATHEDDELVMPPKKDGKVRRLSMAKLQVLFDEAKRRGINLSDPVEK